MKPRKTQNNQNGSEDRENRAISIILSDYKAHYKLMLIETICGASTYIIYVCIHI